MKHQLEIQVNKFYFNFIYNKIYLQKMESNQFEYQLKDLVNILRIIFCLKNIKQQNSYDELEINFKEVNISFLIFFE